MPRVTRRSLLGSAASLVGCCACGPEFIQNTAAVAQAVQGSAQYGVKALFFDVFGTLVDWRTGIAREAEAHLKPRGYAPDWLAFADAWRAQYQPAMEEVRSGRIPFVRLDVLHRRMLDRLLPQFGIKDLPEDTMRSLNLAWHRLDAWPDVTAGFARLANNFLLAPVSNANISLMADLARRNQLRFDAILGAEIAGDYKPKPRVYLAAAEAFDLPPDECMMVSAASHTPDIVGAKTVGLRVASIARPDEYGPGTAASVPKESVDVVAQNLIDLADKLSAGRG
jgi:2-haloacid dehalogenase